MLVKNQVFCYFCYTNTFPKVFKSLKSQMITKKGGLEKQKQTSKYLNGSIVKYFKKWNSLSPDHRIKLITVSNFQNMTEIIFNYF